MTQDSSLKNTTGEVAETALILATTCAAALGPAGIPLALFFGSGAGLPQLFRPEYEPSTALSEERMKLMISKAMQYIERAVHDTASKQASAKIETVYSWYARFNRRINSNEEFTESDLLEMREDVREQLSGNSNLENGMNELAKPDVGKYAMAVYGLGAILGVKIRIYDIAQQQARGEAISPTQMDEVSLYARTTSDKLRGLVHASDKTLGMMLESWKADENEAGRGLTNDEWLKQRDHFAAVLWGGPDGLELVNANAIKLFEISRNTETIAAGIREQLQRSETPG